jgi:hypothetical protein
MNLTYNPVQAGSSESRSTKITIIGPDLKIGHRNK